MSNFEVSAIKNTVAYFYNEHYGSYFGVSEYKLKEDGTYYCGIPTGIYCKKTMDENKIPYMGVLPANKNILYL